MPTGYTAAVQDGTATELRDFALACARNFGALIHMRDEPWDAPIPTGLTCDTGYHDEEIAAARARLDELSALGLDECNARAADEYAEALRQHAERRTKRERDRRRYDAMIAKVTLWDVPEDLRGLREFMLKQLTDSIECDCSDAWDEEPTPLAGEAWRRERLQAASRDFGYHLEERRKKVECIQERQRWLDTLRAALPEPITRNAVP